MHSSEQEPPVIGAAQAAPRIAVQIRSLILESQYLGTSENTLVLDEKLEHCRKVQRLFQNRETSRPETESKQRAGFTENSAYSAESVNELCRTGSTSRVVTGNLTGQTYFQQKTRKFLRQ